MFVENDGEATPFRIRIKQINSDVKSEIFIGTLKSGSNEIELNLSGINFATYGAIDSADFYFSSEAGDHPEKTIYLDGIAVYGA